MSIWVVLRKDQYVRKTVQKSNISCPVIHKRMFVNFAYVRNRWSLIVMLWIMINSNILVLSYQPKKNFARGHINKRDFTNRKQYSEKKWSGEITKEQKLKGGGVNIERKFGVLNMKKKLGERVGSYRGGKTGRPRELPSKKNWKEGGITYKDQCVTSFIASMLEKV